jgi:WD40 repeat protein
MDNDIAGISFVKLTILASLHRHQKAVNVARFSPNGEHIATSGDDGALIVWRKLADQESTSENTVISAKTSDVDRGLSNIDEQRLVGQNDPLTRSDGGGGMTDETIESELPNLESWNVIMIR